MFPYWRLLLVLVLLKTIFNGGMNLLISISDQASKYFIQAKRLFFKSQHIWKCFTSFNVVFYVYCKNAQEKELCSEYIFFNSQSNKQFLTLHQLKGVNPPFLGQARADLCYVFFLSNFHHPKEDLTEYEVNHVALWHTLARK